MAVELPERAERGGSEEAEQRLALYREIFANSSDGIAVVDLGGRYLEQNAAHQALIGYTDAELRDQTPAIHLGKQTFSIVAHELAHSGRYRGEVVSRTKYGEMLDVELSAFVVRSAAGEPLCYVGVKRDITARKRAEQERARLLALEQAARREAEAAVRARDEFLSVAAHELKTPMTSLRGMAQLTLRQLARQGTVEPDSLRRALRMINEQCDKLARLINHLLDMSRIEAGKLAPDRQETELSRLLAGVVVTAQARTAQHRILLDVPSTPVTALVDPLRLEQVITNLLDNAIKYSPHGGDVEVKLALVDERTAWLSVRDHGIGIAPEHRAHIFDRFYQAHGNGQFAGMGLGLHISRQIVELHGGQIAAEFPDDGGTRFVITLPTGLS